MPKNIEELPKDTADKLTELLAKDKSSLTDNEKEFLRARSSYLTEEELSILELKTVHKKKK